MNGPRFGGKIPPADPAAPRYTRIRADEVRLGDTVRVTHHSAPALVLRAIAATHTGRGAVKLHLDREGRIDKVYLATDHTVWRMENSK